MVFSSRLQLRLLGTSCACFLLLFTLAALAYAVSGAFASMASAADEMDDSRARVAAEGALAALQKQLGATVRDNAIWDDAYRAMNSQGAAEWAVENWGTTTADYPLYDTALVLEADGRPLIGYHNGAVLEQVGEYFRGSVRDLMEAASRAGFGPEKLPVSFVKTKEGIAIVSAAAIQPSVDDGTFDIGKAKILVFSKQLTSSVIADIGRTFNIGGLLLTEGPGRSSMLQVGVNDINRHEIARIAWPPLHPGTASYHSVKPTIVVAAVVLLLLLAAVAASGVVVFRTLRTSERDAKYKATHDALTGLLNRAGCLETLDIALKAKVVGPTALYLLDLDGFKPVNDAWGHAVGDKLIQAVAGRLLESLPAEAVVGRMGGDEFSVLCREASEADARPMADRILQTFASPFLVEGRTIEIGGSVGSAKAQTGEIASIELLRRADLALYRAKDLGRGTAVAYDPSLDEDAGRCAELEHELRQAIANREIKVAFQPLMDARTREVIAVEALARWTSPKRGTVPPDLFIRVAEKAGLIDQLGFQVLRTALYEGSRWPKIGVAVNISPLQLKNPYFCRLVKDALAESRFDPARLTIEITEGVLISNPDQAKRAFNGLRELGVKISLDDFGCGYASIGTLREFGFDSMKIDRSLVVALDRDANGSAVLQATVALANALSLPVTAEGIETEDQAMAVKLSGCDRVQGYLFSKPMAAEEITDRFFSMHVPSLPRAG